MILAWCELYLVFGNLFRKLDMEIYQTSPEDLSFRCYFLPIFCGQHLHATVRENQ
ncbi:hypothetical protein EV421DRAFT_1808109 [Armillaria borealis]|uniref:Uncharacterized protein n=1 Tax=Armillaria borealis TaxID=47425 RepID=A0AA39JH01_9AGAR|nr:hypothetical protein EV421DRAFT_1808109 [Armillaria borealis]